MRAVDNGIVFHSGNSRSHICRNSFYVALNLTLPFSRGGIFEEKKAIRAEVRL